MSRPPRILEGARVWRWTPIDDRHTATGNCRHIVAGELQTAASGLAICQYDGEEEFYLFGCDADWKASTDTWHPTLEEALGQAEFEYAGTAATWSVMVVRKSAVPERLSQLVHDGLGTLSDHLRGWVESHVASPPRLERFPAWDGEEVECWVVTDRTGTDDSSYGIVFDEEQETFGLVCQMNDGPEFMGWYGESLATAVDAM